MNNIKPNKEPSDSLSKSNEYKTVDQFSQALLSPLTTIFGIVQLLQRQKLSVEQQDYIGHIHHLCEETLKLTHEFIEQAHAMKLNKLSFPDSAIDNASLKNLKNLRVLIAGDDFVQCNKLLGQLKILGAVCTVVKMDETLDALHQAHQAGKHFQIVMINGEHYNHHIAYLGRTCKKNLLLNDFMLALGLPRALLGFEQDQVYFSGFSCILNLSEAELIPAKLSNSWHTWSTKIHFSDAGAHEQVQRKEKSGKSRILLVEDDPIPQKVTLRQLTELGYLVDTANDGMTALKLLKQRSYDLIFMDIGLPDISGLEVTAEARKRDKHRTPIIGLTIYGLGSDQELGLSAGMDEYVVKPLLQERLKALLKKWIPVN